MAAKRGLGKGLGAIFGEEVIKEQKEKIAMEDGNCLLYTSDAADE